MAIVHNLSYVLGELRPTTSLKESGIARGSILQLLARGADGYCHRSDSLLNVAVQAAEATISQAAIGRDEIDVLLLGTNSLRAPDFLDDFGHALISRLQLDNAYVQLVGFQNCGDSVPILRTAQAMIQAGVASNILLLIADDVTAAGVPRILNDSYLHSDGAGAGLVSGQGTGFRLLNSRVMHIDPSSSPGDAYDLAGHLDSLLDKAVKITSELTDESGKFDFVITHNMNVFYNRLVARAFDTDADKVFGNYSLGHCLAADVFINMKKIQTANKLMNGDRGLIVVPTTRSIGVFEIDYLAPVTGQLNVNVGCKTVIQK